MQHLNRPGKEFPGLLFHRISLPEEFTNFGDSLHTLMSIRKSLLIGGILLLMPWLTNAQQHRGWRPGEMEATILLTNPDQSAILHQLKINADMPLSVPGIATLYLTPEENEKLNNAGLATTITIGNLGDYYAGWWDRDVPPGYYTYQQIIDIADSLAAAYPTICQKEILGYSIGGRQLAALKISDNVTSNETEPELMFEAGIHGDEVGGPENLIRFARDLCKGYGNNTQITNLINTRETWLWLMVNPDGRQSMSRYNDNNVDINRDGGYMWNGEGNSPGAWSQPETRVLRDFGTSRQFTVFTDYHSGTEYISYPWSYREDAAPDKPHMHQLASVYASTSGYSNIPYAQGYSGMYPINGSTKDYNYGSLGSVSWSMEISMQKQPPASSINNYYQKNKPAMMAMMEKSGLGLHGVVTDSISGMPVAAIVWVNNYYPCYNDPVQGDFHKYLTGGTYDVKITASGYQSVAFEAVNIPTNGTFTLNAALLREPDTSFARKVMGCYILNNNPNDEGFTPGAVGPADNLRYSLGKNGWLILDMGDTIVNRAGDDIRVIEDDGTNEGYTVYASNGVDGPWTVLGDGNGSASFDLTSSLTKARYLKIKDSGAGSTTVPDAGVDVDAVANLQPAARPLFKALATSICAGGIVQFTDMSRGTPQGWLWQFDGGSPATSTDQNPVVSYNEQGVYDVTLTIFDGFTSSRATRAGYITALTVPEVNLGSDTLLCYDYQQATLDAGNPGAQYLWNTGDTTQSITAQCTGIDVTNYYSVIVQSPNGCSNSDTIGVTCTICEGTVQPAGDAQAIVGPVPTRDYVTIRTQGPPPHRIELADVSGRLLLAISETTAATRVNLSDYESGLYFIRIMVAGQPDQIFKLLKL